MGPPASPVLVASVQKASPESELMRLSGADPFLGQSENTAYTGTWMPACQAVISAFSLSSKDRQSRQPQWAGFEELQECLSTLTHATSSHGDWGAHDSARTLFSSRSHSFICYFYRHLLSVLQKMGPGTGHIKMKQARGCASREVTTWPWMQVPN